MATYSPSKITKDGNTYNFRDTTKIPLAGSNAISGSLIPSTDGTVNLGGTSYQWNNAYIKSLTINGTAAGDILTHNASEFVDVSSNQTVNGQKTFSHAQTGVGRDLYHFASSPYSKNTPPANISFQYIWFIGNSASQGLTNNWYSGYIEQRVFPNGSAQGRWFIRDTSESGLGIELFVNGSTKQFRPQGNNITDLGTSTNKWKDVNTVLLNGKTPAYSTDIPTKVSQLTNDSGFITSENALPVGSYIQFAGSQAPEGFLVCNGGEISRTTYSALFAVIGTTYGSGDGSTTFNLPNLTDRFLQGSTSVGTVKNAGLPNIVGNHNQALESNTSAKDMNGFGAFSIGYQAKSADSDSGIHYYIQLEFDASRSNSIYGSSSTVQPPAVTCLICIKY